ncbi:MAG: hypothetical protein ACLUFN_03065 [Eubacterium sp.]
MNTKRFYLSITFIFTLLTAVFICFAVIKDKGIFITLAVTFGTCLYHFAVRLAVGGVIPKKFNYKSAWFMEKSFENGLYKKLKVKKWKQNAPTYNPKTYSSQQCTLEEIVNTTCRNEVIHEVNMLLSFVPLVLIIPFGTPAAFIITSIAGCICDFFFVILQRYNRPRLIKLIQRKNNKTH